jgi:hypothetical protein
VDGKMGRRAILHKVWCNGKILSPLTQFGMAESGSQGVSIDSVPVVVVDIITAKIDQQARVQSFRHSIRVKSSVSFSPSGI